MRVILPTHVEVSLQARDLADLIHRYMFSGEHGVKIHSGETMYTRPGKLFRDNSKYSYSHGHDCEDEEVTDPLMIILAAAEWALMNKAGLQPGTEKELKSMANAILQLLPGSIVLKGDN